MNNNIYAVKNYTGETFFTNLNRAIDYAKESSSYYNVYKVREDREHGYLYVSRNPVWSKQFWIVEQIYRFDEYDIVYVSANVSKCIKFLKENYYMNQYRIALVSLEDSWEDDDDGYTVNCYFKFIENKEIEKMIKEEEETKEEEK